MRPPRPGCWTCWSRPVSRAGRCGRPARCWSSASCAPTGGWAGGSPASWRTRRLVAARCTACWTGRSPRSCGCSRRGRGRPLPPQARSPRFLPGAGLGLAGQRAPGAGARGPAVSAAAAARPQRPQAVPGLGGVPPNSIWIYDTTHFTRAGVAATVIEDLVSRKWLAEIVSAEETSTQVQVVFTDALEAEGLLERVAARQDGLVDPSVDDPSRPVLLALSDNGPQMTSGSTREFMALCAIHQHFGRPGTPTDQAWTWVAVRPRQGRMAPPERDPRPGDLARRARGRAEALQRGAAARRDRLRHPQRRAPGPRAGDPQGAPGRTGAGAPAAACLASRAPSV
jgi:hypothetical protein